MKRFASEQDLLSEGWRLDQEQLVPGDQLSRFPGDDLLLANVPSGRRLNEDADGGPACFLEQIDGDAQFPFESGPSLTGPADGSRQVDGGGVGSGLRGTSPYAFNEGVLGFEPSAEGKVVGRARVTNEVEPLVEDQRHGDVSPRGSSRRAPERDLYGQTSLERLEEENSSLRAITKYLIHERKELRKKADTASKRNQNLANLVHVMKWSLQQGGGGSGLHAAQGAAAERSPPVTAENSLLLG